METPSIYSVADFGFMKTADCSNKVSKNYVKSTFPSSLPNRIFDRKIQLAEQFSVKLTKIVCIDIWLYGISALGTKV